MCCWLVATEPEQLLAVQQVTGLAQPASHGCPAVKNQPGIADQARASFSPAAEQTCQMCICTAAPPCMSMVLSPSCTAAETAVTGGFFQLLCSLHLRMYAAGFQALEHVCC
jgi:hypothetical protein